MLVSSCRLPKELLISRQTLWLRQIYPWKRCALPSQMPLLFHRICKAGAPIRVPLIAYFDTWHYTFLDGNRRAECFPAIPGKSPNGVCILLRRLDTASFPRLLLKLFYIKCKMLPRGARGNVWHKERRKHRPKTKTVNRVFDADS